MEIVKFGRCGNIGPRYSQAWNIGPSDLDARPVKWLVENLCRKWGNSAAYELQDSGHPHEANYLKLDCSKAKQELGWTPKWNLEKTVDKIVEWVTAYRDKRDMLAISLKQIQEYSRVR